jgi:hypothetical protein
MDGIYPLRKNRPIPVVALTSDPVGDGMTGRIGSTSKVAAVDRKNPNQLSHTLIAGSPPAYRCCVQFAIRK